MLDRSRITSGKEQENDREAFIYNYRRPKNLDDTANKFHK